MIEVTDLSIDRGGHNVVSGLSFSVDPGEVTALRGPSGVGKTSVLGVLAGLIVPRSGRVRLLGRKFTGLSDRRRSAVRRTVVGMACQTDELFPELTIEENVTLPLRWGPRARTTEEYRTTVLPLLDSLGIADLARRFPHEVSGGQLQRATVARAVVNAPAVVLADEPTESLDRDAASSAMRLLIDLARERGASVVVVTHDDEVAAAADSTVMLAPRSAAIPATVT